MKSHLLVLLSWLHAATAQTTIFTVPPVQTNSSSVPPLTTLPPATATISPSAPPLSQSFPVNVTISGITLQLINVPPLIDLETRFSLWENTTRDFFNQFYFNNDVGIRNFTTDISFLSQDSVLRNGVIVTTFNYSQSLAYTSLDGSQTPGYYAVYPFTTEEGNAQYVAALNLSFTGWENMMVPLPVPLLPGQTGAPSFAPSGAPAASLIPSVGPSALTVNSSAPSLFPSLAPSQIPSLGLSEAPSELAASNEPSSVPSMAETSLAPSSEETTAEPVEMIDVLLMNIQLPLKGGGVLEDDEIDMWERVTDEWFADFFSGSDRRRLQASGIESIISKFTFVRQEEDNSIVYNQNLKYEASEETADSEAVALLPFNDDEANVKYGEILQREFANMKGLILPLTIPKILGRNATPLDEGIGDDDSGLSMGALIGIIAAGAAVLLVCAYVAYGVVRGSGDGDIGVEQRDHESEVSPQFHMSRSEEELSMMDDPYMPHKQKSFDDKILDVGYGDRSVATVDYDYSKVYGGGDTSVVSSAGGTMGDTTRLTSGTVNTAALAALGAESQFRDSGVHEQVLVIVAPAGKLGVVIDTPDDGAPVVHAVKDTSVIADQIQVGDKLVAVDDEDVRSMTAIRVSKLISKKSNNPSRKLTIIRTTTME